MESSGQPGRIERAADAPAAIITGAGRGIGRAVAAELAGLGYRLALASRHLGELNESLARSGGDGAVFRTDVTRFEEVDTLVHASAARFGRLDAIVHCAGLAPVRPIAELTVGEWHDVLNTNLSAAFYLCRAAWPVFARQQGGGVIVNVSSLAARDPFPGFAAYGAAKAGLNLFGLSAVREGERIGLRVHTVAPGATETAMFRQIMSPAQYPADKTLDPADVARVIGQCVAGTLRYTSGEVIYVHRTM